MQLKQNRNEIKIAIKMKLKRNWNEIEWDSNWMKIERKCNGNEIEMIQKLDKNEIDIKYNWDEC